MAADYLSESTREVYGRIEKSFLLWRGKRSASDSTLREYFEHLKKTRKPSTVRVAKTVLRRKYGSQKLWKTIRTPRAERRKKRLKPDELKKLSKADRKWGLLVRFLYVTGARISEALAVRLEGHEIDDGMVTFTVPGKGGLDRSLVCTEALVQEILKVWGSHAYLFEKRPCEPYRRCWAGRKIRELGQKVGIKAFPHLLRHTVASDLLDSGENPAAVADFLGHADIKLVLTYYGGTVKHGTLKKLIGA